MQLLREVRFKCFRGNGHVERDKVQPALDRLVDTALAWPVIASDDDLLGRVNLEKLAMEQPDDQRVADCVGFDPAFRPRLFIFDQPGLSKELYDLVAAQSRPEAFLTRWEIWQTALLEDRQ